MAIDTLLQLFAKIFIMVAVGYFLRRRNIITVQIKQALNFMIVNVFMPFSILVSGNSAFSKEMSHSLLLVAGLSLTTISLPWLSGWDWENCSIWRSIGRGFLC